MVIQTQDCYSYCCPWLNYHSHLDKDSFILKNDMVIHVLIHVLMEQMKEWACESILFVLRIVPKEGKTLSVIKVTDSDMIEE